jgi:hypothetical protein
VNFSFTWRHMDGSVVTFSPDGWTSSDPEKAAWLNAMSHLTSSEPVAPPLIRIWLAEECQLVEVQVSDALTAYCGGGSKARRASSSVPQGGRVSVLVFVTQVRQSTKRQGIP